MHRSALNLPEAAAASVLAGDATFSRGTALPRVCFVAPLAWPVFSGDRSIRVVGGAEVQQSMLARAFAAAGFETSMICLDYGQPEGVQLDRVTVFKAYRPKAGAPVVRFIHPRLTMMWRAMRRANADIYYFRTGSVLAGYGAAFCRLNARRSIYAGASDVDFIPGRELIEFARDRGIFRYGLRHVDAIVAQNPVQVREVREHYAREATLIPSCYRPPASARGDPQGPVGWVATVREYKRPAMFLEIARRLPQRRFLMIGGPGGDDAESMAFYRSIEAEARSLPNVEFLGFVPLADVEAQFDRMSMFVNTSINEGFPNTFLQAWARGVPSVGTLDTESRLEGRPVYAVARDAGEAALEIERLLGDRHQWEDASSRCRAYFERHHSIEAVTARYAELFTALTCDNRGPVSGRP